MRVLQRFGLPRELAVFPAVALLVVRAPCQAALAVVGLGVRQRGCQSMLGTLSWHCKRR